MWIAVLTVVTQDGVLASYASRATAVVAGVAVLYTIITK
jgi:hypothetical protein